MKQKQFSHGGVFRRTLTLLILFAALAFASGSRVTLLSASAAEESAENTSTKAVKVMFKDGSGRYLKKRSKGWFLYGRKGKPLTGIRYLNIKKTDGLVSGFYMFNQKGKLIQKKAIYYFNKEKVNGVTFSGYYQTADNGRFPVKEGLCWISYGKRYGVSFGGVYYTKKYGKLSGWAQLHYLQNVRLGKYVFNGYYYFDQYGRLCSTKAFRAVKQAINGTYFKGYYYFGDTYGKLLQKEGWVWYNNQKYYIDQTGKMLTNCWKDSYYLQADGTIAYNKKLPDGSYAGYDGHRWYTLTSLESQLRSMISGYSGTWSIYAKDLKSGGTVIINDCSMAPASTIKAFVMAATYDRIYNNKLSYTSTIRTLLTNMITVSDNESYNALVRYNSSSGSFLAGAAEINDYLSRNGYTYTRCHHTLHPSASASTGDGSNATSAKECGMLLEKIYNGDCVSAEYSKEMLDLLCAQTRRWKIPSGVPAGVKVANKTGENSDVQNDIAIVFGPKTDYILCVFSATGNEYYSNSRIKTISETVYNFFN